MTTAAERIATVAGTPGLIAFWDFQHARDGVWIAHVDPRAADRAYPVRLRRMGDPRAYAPAEWPGRDEHDRLELRPEGPFGQALRCNLGYIYAEVARRDFDGTALDLHGRRSFTMLAWTKFIGQRHLVAGIWDEGGWDPYGGRRQAALFAGLFNSPSVIAHLSATGAASYPQSAVPGAQYARMKAIDGGAFADRTWVCLAMTYDGGRGLVDAWLDGVRTPCRFRDAVAAAVFGDETAHDVNPAPFPQPIFAPRAFLLKCNGYDRSSGIAEHRVHVDLDAETAVYGRTPATAAGTFRLHLTLERDGRPVAGQQFACAPGQPVPLPGFRQARLGDVVVAVLQRAAGDEGVDVGKPVRHTLTEGAPFTFGRALGLGSEEPKHGSQLLIGGVAVVDRVLAADELRRLSFANA